MVNLEGGGVVIESIISSRLVRVALDQQSPLKSRIRVRVALHCPTVEANSNLKHRIKVKTPQAGPLTRGVNGRQARLDIAISTSQTLTCVINKLTDHTGCKSSERAKLVWKSLLLSGLRLSSSSNFQPDA